MLHSVPVGENNYGDEGGKGNFFCTKITVFSSFSGKSVKLFAVIGTGHLPCEKFQENSPIFEQEGTRPLKNLYLTPPPPVL